MELEKKSAWKKEFQMQFNLMLERLDEMNKNI